MINPAMSQFACNYEHVLHAGVRTGQSLAEYTLEYDANLKWHLPMLPVTNNNWSLYIL